MLERNVKTKRNRKRTAAPELAPVSQDEIKGGRRKKSTLTIPRVTAEQPEGSEKLGRRKTKTRLSDIPSVDPAVPGSAKEPTALSLPAIQEEPGEEARSSATADAGVTSPKQTEGLGERAQASQKGEAEANPGDRAAKASRGGRSHRRERKQGLFARAKEGIVAFFAGLLTVITSVKLPKIRIPSPSEIVASQNFRRNAIIIVGIIVSVAIIYPSVRDYYVAVRERDQLAVELAAVKERNEAIVAQVEYLQSIEGQEDLARSEFGLVKEGENAVNVFGSEDNRGLKVHAEVLPEDIYAPTTWYSPFLDPLFGFDPKAPVNPS